MEPVSIIAGALAAGAAAVSKKLGGQLAEYAYDGLKHLIINRYKRGGSVAALEENPSSDIQRKALEEALAKTEAPKDADVLQKANDLTTALNKLPHADLAAIGIRISELQAINAHFGEVTVDGIGTGVEIDEANLQGDLTIETVRVRGPN
jgi:hypothetical protein